jgi:hypothetical protein
MAFESVLFAELGNLFGSEKPLANATSSIKLLEGWGAGAAAHRIGCGWLG